MSHPGGPTSTCTMRAGRRERQGMHQAKPPVFWTESAATEAELRRSRGLGLEISLTWGRLTSLVVAGVYMVLAAIAGGLSTALLASMGLILPLACIWFGTALGESRLASPLRVTRPTPGIV